jgi:Putative auto-transporter adhesin, head GIN domain
MDASPRYPPRERRQHPGGRRLRIGGALCVALVVGLVACARGEGEPRSETREVDSFARIEVSAGIVLTVEIGNERRVEVRAQENILPLIGTDIVGDTLRIGGTGSYTTAEPVEVTIVTPGLDGIVVSGGSRAAIATVDVSVLDVGVSGGSNVSIAGTSEELRLEVSGGSRGELGSLAAETVTLDVSGGSNVTVTASEDVRGSASGESLVTVLGDAAVTVDVSTGAEVARQ